MTISTTFDGKTCTLAIAGDINTLTAPELDEAVETAAGRADKMILDMAKVGYISSAGIRSVLKAHRCMGSENLKLKNLNKNVANIFTITGFDKMLDIG